MQLLVSAIKWNAIEWSMLSFSDTILQDHEILELEGILEFLKSRDFFQYVLRS